MLREYYIIEIDNNDTTNPNSRRGGFNVIATKVDTNEKVELKNISLPNFARIGDLIRWCDHNFYDVIDSNGDFVYRHKKTL